MNPITVKQKAAIGVAVRYIVPSDKAVCVPNERRLRFCGNLGKVSCVEKVGPIVRGLLDNLSLAWVVEKSCFVLRKIHRDGEEISLSRVLIDHMDGQHCGLSVATGAAEAQGEGVVLVQAVAVREDGDLDRHA